MNKYQLLVYSIRDARVLRHQDSVHVCIRAGGREGGLATTKAQESAVAEEK